jgi:CheY-like chemotaxis protein
LSNTTNEKLSLSISDNGIGIAPMYHNKIFEMFFRLSGKTDGSGIGLYIVKDIVEKLGRAVQVKSNLGTGSTFYYYTKKFKTMITDLQPKFETVMIIDDITIDLYITSRIILKNHFGKKVLEYSAADEALKYLQENQNNISVLPQIIFTDIYMPLFSGFEFLEAYDKLAPALKNHCRLYILSSTINDADIARVRNDKNVVSFQLKPITKEFLERIIAD